MSEICTCVNADIIRKGNDDPICRKCGCWWIPKYGSTEPRPDFEVKKMFSETVKHSFQVKTKTGRNDSCPCGSGKKYKKCCMRRKG